MSPKNNPVLNQQVVDRAKRVQNQVVSDIVDRLHREQGVVAEAVAGAGKSHFMATTTGRLRQAGARVVVAAPTNEQVYSLVDRIARLNPNLPVVWLPASGRALPAETQRLANVGIETTAEAVDRRTPLVVATLNKLADAQSRGLGGYDALLIDEAFQADAARYYAAGGIATTHLLVGDSGQLDPFSTLPDATWWRGGPEDPLQTAVGVLLRNHPASTAVHRLPITWRLDPRSVDMTRAFYRADHHFDAAVLPGIRQLNLAAGRGREHAAIDRALDEAAQSGWAHLTLPGTSIMAADPDIARLIVDLVARLLERHPTVMDEQQRASAALDPTRIAVGVSRNNQKDLLRTLFDAAGYDDIVVNTANKLQGMQYDVVIAWHPLAGEADPSAFYLDPGRLCVLLTRHRHACIVVGRETDRTLLDGMPPATPAYLGWNPDPVLDGWEVHEAVFDQLEKHHVAA